MTTSHQPFDPMKVTLTAAQWDVLLALATGQNNGRFDGGTARSLIARGLVTVSGRRQLTGLTVNGSITLLHRERPAGGKHTWEHAGFHAEQIKRWEEWKRDTQQQLADHWG